jgi:hypothetical protein
MGPIIARKKIRKNIKNGLYNYLRLSIIIHYKESELLKRRWVDEQGTFRKTN